MANLFFLLLLFICCDAVAQRHSESALKVQVESPSISVSTRVRENNFMTLPSLDYKLNIEQQCMAGFSPAVLSLSAADTRRSFGADMLAKTENLMVEFTIPKEQIGPISVGRFCFASEPSVEAEEAVGPQQDVLLIPAVLSLQASLTCANESESKIFYASAPLDVSLACEAHVLAPPTTQ